MSPVETDQSTVPERANFCANRGKKHVLAQILGRGHREPSRSWVIKGAMDGPAFVTYIRDVQVSDIAPGTVVILDNLAAHQGKDAVQALREDGCWFLDLAPYSSPDLTPIEQSFSQLPPHLRRMG